MDYFNKLDAELTEAYLKGKDAYYDNQGRNSNPYDELSEEYKFWDGGYMESKHEESDG